jgi:putative PIG3 family NAD(P)H quinone oxidoreductase
MRAVLMREPGGPEVLELGDAAMPVPGARHIRVRVHATAVNRADLMQRRGHYPAPAGWPTDIPGLEYAGVVEQTGPRVQRWRGGERVMGLVGGGSYAEYVVVHEDEAVPIPERLSFAEAAAIPEAFLTAHDALRMRLGVPQPASGSILIHAVASGVGSAAMQLAHVMGLQVYGTARSAWKLEPLRSLAPATLIDVTTHDFVELIRAQLGGVDYIMDLVGGNYLEKNLLAAAPRARVAVVGLVAGATAQLDMRTLLNKRLTIVGTVLRARPLEEKIQVARSFEQEVVPWLVDGRVRPVIDRVLPMQAVQEAHRVAEANESVGKVVLDWSSPSDQLSH